MDDREKLHDLICGSPAIKCEHPTGDCKGCHDLVKHLLANGVVVREKGEWEFRQNKRYTWCTDLVCTACKATIDSHVDNSLEYRQTAIKKELLYCPNCGADMRKEKSDGTAQV